MKYQVINTAQKQQPMTKEEKQRTDFERRHAGEVIRRNAYAERHAMDFSKWIVKRGWSHTEKGWVQPESELTFTDEEVYSIFNNTFD